MFEPEKETYVSLATFRKSGVPVNTPVWIAGRDNTLYVFSEGKAGKVKRIRNNPSVRLAACDVRGNLHTGDWIDGTARIVDDPGELAQAYPAFDSKYGIQMRVANFLSRLSGRFRKRAMIAIALDNDALDDVSSKASTLDH